MSIDLLQHRSVKTIFFASSKLLTSVKNDTYTKITGVMSLEKRVGKGTKFEQKLYAKIIS